MRDERVQLVADGDELLSRMLGRSKATFARLGELAESQDEDGLRRLEEEDAPFRAEIQALDARLHALLGENEAAGRGLSA